MSHRCCWRPTYAGILEHRGDHVTNETHRLRTPGRRALTGRRPATARTSRPHGTATRYCPDVAPSRDGDPLLPGRRALTGRRPATARTSRPQGTATRYCPDVAPSGDG